MCNFIHRQDPGELIPDLLKTRVLGFRESPEYADVTEFLDIPGVVCGAFAKYLLRLYDSHKRESFYAADPAIQSAHEVMETMACSIFPSVRASLSDEIFENFFGQSASAQIVRDLQAHTAEFYDQWIRALS